MGEKKAFRDDGSYPVGYLSSPTAMGCMRAASSVSLDDDDELSELSGLSSGRRGRRLRPSGVKSIGFKSRLGSPCSDGVCDWLIEYINLSLKGRNKDTYRRLNFDVHPWTGEGSFKLLTEP